MKPFNHFNARTVNEAVKLLKNSRGKARLISGGTDLLGSLKDKILPEYPETIINIKTIQNLDYIREDARGLKIGALARLEDIAQSQTVKERYKLLADAAESVATPQIRLMGTVGGNLCQDVRCWYYRYPDHIGGHIPCYLKGGKGCYALNAENRYHSVFGGLRAGNPPCRSACPSGVEIPDYLSKVREGKLYEAAGMLLASNPIPSITGRVCPHFCEQQCNRAGFDESVSVRDIERYMGDYVLEHADELIAPPEAESGKSVAIVGSGPAGLSAAYYLRMSGHRITVFDKMEEPGGLLTYVIPEYRLPKDIVRRVVQAIQNTGVEFRLKVDIGKDVTLKDLNKNFDSVFIATGAWNPVSIGLEGEQESTRFGMQFLMNIHQGIKEAPGKRVLVIGGGNAALDVAVSALRLGAETAVMACLESLDEMPALPWERQQAVEEGVKLMPSWGPYRIIRPGGKVTGMELVRCTSAFNSEGHFAPSYDNTIKETVEADVIMMAVGYSTDLHFISPDLPLQTSGGLIIAGSETQATNSPGVFAGGAVVHGPATVIEAVASGKRAAAAMDLYLGGSGVKADDDKPIAPFTTFNNNYLKKMSRIELPKIPVGQRRIDIEDTSGLRLSETEAEANRCFNCSCVSVNASDIGVALAALDAKVKIAGSKGFRTIPISEFFGSLRNSLATDEMVVEIQIRRPPKGARQIFMKYRLREAVDFAIVSIASVIAVKDGTCKDARIALGAVAPRPIRLIAAEQALKGKPIKSDTIEAAAQASVEGAIPLKDNAYKIEITKTLVKRAILS